MKVSLVQMNSVSDKAANIAAARALIERAVAEEAPDWVLLPEQFDWAGGAKGDKAANAEILPGGPAYAMAQELAAKHRIFIHAGSIMEKIPGDERIHNTSVVFNREGEEIARYRKIHLFDVTTPEGVSYRESATVKAGETVVTYDCEGVSIGCSICYDLRFPDLFQALAERGAQVIALPAAFTLQTGKDHWETLLRARARSKPRPMSAPARRREASPSATSSARPTAIRWSPIPGAMSSPRPPTASASSRRGSTWRSSSACGG
jgi:nitrilase